MSHLRFVCVMPEAIAWRLSVAESLSVVEDLVVFQKGFVLSGGTIESNCTFASADIEVNHLVRISFSVRAKLIPLLNNLVSRGRTRVSDCGVLGAGLKYVRSASVEDLSRRAPGGASTRSKLIYNCVHWSGIHGTKYSLLY